MREAGAPANRDQPDSDSRSQSRAINQAESVTPGQPERTDKEHRTEGTILQMTQAVLVIVVILAVILLNKAGNGLVEATTLKKGCSMVLLLIVGYLILGLVLHW